MCVGSLIFAQSMVLVSVYITLFDMYVVRMYSFMQKLKSLPINYLTMSAIRSGARVCYFNTFMCIGMCNSICVVVLKTHTLDETHIRSERLSTRFFVFTFYLLL